MSHIRYPAEWEKHDACWLAWPSHGDLWKEDLEPAQDEFTSLCRSILGERLEILVPDESNEAMAADALKGLDVRFHRVPFGDIWLRDTGPVFVKDGANVVPTRFGFNGWGGKYVLPNDDEVSGRIAELTGLGSRAFSWVMEGGSLEVDGAGTCLTTRQCLLNPNRNPGMSREEIEAGLAEALGIRKVLWLGDGLLNDHTDGHIDTLARFVRPGVVACMEAADDSDPNAAVLTQIRRDLESFGLEIALLPSPGAVKNDDGKILAASYANFYIANGSVVVPTYGVPRDDAAVRAVGALFPGRKAVGVSARAILSGGGAFHCITQQQPSAGDR